MKPHEGAEEVVLLGRVLSGQGRTMNSPTAQKGDSGVITHSGHAHKIFKCFVMAVAAFGLGLGWCLSYDVVVAGQATCRNANIHYRETKACDNAFEALFWPTFFQIFALTASVFCAWVGKINELRVALLTLLVVTTLGCAFRIELAMYIVYAEPLEGTRIKAAAMWLMTLWVVNFMSIALVAGHGSPEQEFGTDKVEEKSQSETQWQSSH